MTSDKETLSILTEDIHIYLHAHSGNRDIFACVADKKLGKNNIRYFAYELLSISSYICFIYNVNVLYIYNPYTTTESNF